MTGLATGVIMLTVARSGSSLGKAVIDPTHNSLIADYYPIETRSHVFSFHRAANAVGALIGPITAGMLAYWFGWRVPFLVFVIPTVIFAVLALQAARAGPRPLGAARDGCHRRGHQHRGDGAVVRRELAHGAEGRDRSTGSGGACRSSPSSLIGFVTLGVAALRAGVRPRASAAAASLRAIAEPFQLVGLVLGSRIATRRFIGNISGLIRFLAKIAVGTSVASIGFALAPNICVAVVAQLRDLGVAGDARARHPRRPLAGDPAPGPRHGLLRRVAVGHPRACSSCRSSAGSPTPGRSASGCSPWCRCSSSARSSCAASAT